MSTMSNPLMNFCRARLLFGCPVASKFVRTLLKSPPTMGDFGMPRSRHVSSFKKKFSLSLLLSAPDGA